MTNNEKDRGVPVSGDETTATPEQEARDLLEAAGVEGAQSMTTGDLVGIANLVAEVRRLRLEVTLLEESLDAERDDR